jgi:hypothetical protein
MAARHAITGSVAVLSAAAGLIAATMAAAERRHKEISLSLPTKSLPHSRRAQRRKRSIGLQAATI